ncbi:MAG: formate dehydrogenase subunit gamma [Proteobacteria bacterium]|nr:formate dehydrogenase subunit gamma [Pseudomonadota bacterium]
MIKRILLSVFITAFMCMAPAFAQDSSTDVRAATGGAQTLDDILARQQRQKVDSEFRRSANGAENTAADISSQLGTLGSTSNAEVFRALRYGTADVKVTSSGPAANIIIQDSGMRWLEFRKGPLKNVGGYLLLGTIAFLALFYIFRGKIMIEGEKTGVKVLRFKLIERFGHWLMAGSFMILALTGLVSLFGRFGLIPLIGKSAYAAIANVGIFVHNWTSWAFMVGLVLVFVMWVVDNIPKKHDLKWIAQGGGLFTEGVHPPSTKFNAGQKMIFWIVVLFGALISVTGLSLLFPFQITLFAPLYEMLNSFGISGALGLGELATAPGPYEEMQLAQVWHATIAFGFIAVIFAHIYIGSFGMEGAIDAMKSGEVEEQWAKEHHGLWLEEEKQKQNATPAE